MATYINAKLRKAIAENDTRTINRECYPLFRADHPDYVIGKSDPAIFREWVKEFIATATAKPEPKTAEKTTSGRKTKTAEKPKTASRDKEEPKPKAKTNSKSKSGSKSRKTAEVESATEIDRNTLIAKLKADYVSGKVSADKFVEALAILTNM